MSRDCPPHNTFCFIVVLFRCYAHVYISVYAYCNNSGSVPYEQQVPITLTVILVPRTFPMADGTPAPLQLGAATGGMGRCGESSNCVLQEIGLPIGEKEKAAITNQQTCFDYVVAALAPEFMTKARDLFLIFQAVPMPRQTPYPAWTWLLWHVPLASPLSPWPSLNKKRTLPML